jgi:osomolarity two-component system sensor histidine kinase NIK1
MPFMGGMEATELIRAYEMHKGLLRIPIIALTAHASTSQSQSSVMALANLLFQ